MLPILRSPTSASTITLALVLMGCGANPTQPSNVPGGAQTAGPPDTVATEHEHAHPNEGPHGGSLIELGNEAYHAELVHAAAGNVTIYLLDSAGKTGVPIDAAEVIINLKHEGRGEQFKLAAAADTNDPPGKSSRFVSSDAGLAEDLDHEGADAQLVVNISGKPYRGTIAHEHGHDDGHGHE